MEAPEITPETQIDCDMDGVLVDFDTTVIALLNATLDNEKLPMLPKRKAYYYLRGEVQRKLGDDWRASATADLQIPEVRSFMFEVVGSNPAAVFSVMQPFPDAISTLWPFITGAGYVVNILTAPITARKHAPEGSTAELGKTQWVTNPDNGLIPQPAGVIISPARSKADYAVINGVSNILIDDKASTVDAWNDRGGIGILHIPGNSAKTVTELKKAGLHRGNLQGARNENQ